MVVEAAPSAPLEVAETDLLLELLIIALDAPAQLGEIDQFAAVMFFRKGGEPVFGRLLLAFGPLDQQPLLQPAFGAGVIKMRGTNPHTRKARAKPLGRSLPPLDRAPGSACLPRSSAPRHKPQIAIQSFPIRIRLSLQCSSMNLDK